MPRLPLILAALALLACEGDVVDPTTGDTTAPDPDTTTTTTDPTVDPPTSNGPFPDPSSDPTVDPTEDPPPPLCTAPEPVTEAEFPAAMATRVCQRRNACGCASPTCTVDVAAALSDMATWSKGQQLTFDPDCAAILFARAAAIVCDDQVTAIEEGCGSCNVYHGARMPGEACDLNAWALYASQCAADLACSPVQQVCTGVELGVAGIGEFCFIDGTTIARCPDNALCDSGGSGQCQLAPPPGEPCLNGACGGADFCNPNNICRPKKTTGEPCDSLLECHSLECTANVCASTPWICRPPWSAGA